GRSPIPLDFACVKLVRRSSCSPDRRFPCKVPDLNAIEYVWGWMKRSIATHEPHDYHTLEAAIFSGRNPNRHPSLHRPYYHRDEGNYRCRRRTFAYCVIGEQRASFSRRIVAVTFCLRLYKV